MKKYVPVLVALIFFAAGVLFVLPGFQKRTDVYLQDYFVSGESSNMIVKTFPSGSMGFIRDMEIEKVKNEIHCSFYRAFGGLNSSIGSENMFEIKLDTFTEKIYFDRGEKPDMLVLERDPATNVWTRAAWKSE